MKAVTVAGGSSDDPEIEQGTAVPEAEPDVAPDIRDDDPTRTNTPDPRAQPEAEATAQPSTEPDPERPADTKADAGAKAEAGAAKAGAKAEAERQAGAEAGAEPEAPAGAGAQAEGDNGAEAAEPEANAAAEVATGSSSEAAPEADVPVEPVADAEAGPGAEAAAKPARQAAGEARSEPEAEATAGPKGDARGAAAPGLANRPAPESIAGAEAAADVEPVADGKVDPKAGPQGEAKAGPEAEAAAQPTRQTARAADGKAGAEAGAEPEGKAPAGPHGEEDAGPAAGADVTQVLVVPKPRPVRTPSWAREAEAEPEADSERTSKFVALKPLDVAPPAAPEPKAEPRPRPQPPEASAPLPPLDLLAELTNTAPPPETPRRTAVRRVKVWTPILLVLAGAYVGAQMLRPLPAPQMVSAETTRTVDGQFSIPWPAKGQGAVRVAGSGDIGTFGEQKPVPTASVAKVMTAYVILKGHPLRKSDPGPDITVDAKTVADGNSEHESRIVGLTAGQKFGQQDMLKMLMIPSGNNVARLLARWDTGTDSEAAFVAKMNAAAKELGMTNTTYTDPSGLDAGTVSTAADQLKLAEAVMKDEVFRSIVTLPNATIKGLSTPLDNNNDLLNSSIRGIKTGSSTPAGGALMWAAYKTVDNKDQLILGTLMDQHVDGPDLNAANSLILVQDNSKKIIEAVRGALASAPVIRKGQQVGYLDDGLGGRMPLVATKDVTVIGVPGQQLKLSLVPGASPLPHTAKAGSEVAVLTVGEGEGAKSVPVAVQGNLAEPSFGTRMTRMR
ncbi:serine hydrolase [Streptomyces sp. NPDC001586]|uniref:D-alanyl-D-alanine carboxypeptidase n=1 Tax=Streptomyces sp. NPDC001586 TaxID=3154387 RepID=UPI00332F8355